MKNVKGWSIEVISLLLAPCVLLAGACDDASPISVPAGTGGTPPVTASAGSSGTGASSRALPMDTGYVDKASNDFGIQGSWYWYSDSDHGDPGLTTLTNVQANMPPYVAAKGMCITGNTPGGVNDGYATWGAGIGLNLNQGTEESGDTTAKALYPAPKCFSVTLSADSKSPGAILGKLQEANPMPPTTADPEAPQEAPSIALAPGKAIDVCIDKVKAPSWCAGSDHSPGDCADPARLSAGVAGLQIQALAGDNGGDISVCVTSIVPHD